MANVGLDPMAVAQAQRATSDFCAYLELHIEQGPCLEKASLALGGSAINGARRLNCHFTGLVGHAGTVPMGIQAYLETVLSCASSIAVRIDKS